MQYFLIKASTLSSYQKGNFISKIENYSKMENFSKKFELAQAHASTILQVLNLHRIRKLI